MTQAKAFCGVLLIGAVLATLAGTARAVPDREREAAAVEEGLQAARREREEIGRERERVEAALRETREALGDAADRGAERRVRELAGKLVDLARHAGALAARNEMIRHHIGEMERELVALRRGGDRPDAPHPEREHARHQIEVMRLAMKALAEADRKDLAEQMEQKIHAIELALAGRRDEEARRIRAGAPADGQMAELLGYAGKLWRKFEKPEKAEPCEELSRRFGDLHHRKREAAERERERDAAERRDEPGREHDRAEERGLPARVERLEAELREMQNLLKRVLKELRRRD